MFKQMTSPDERAVRETLAGRQEAYGQLVDRYLSVAIALAYSRLRTYAEAEEVAQESFLKAYEGLDTLRDPAKFGPWFIGIVRNCVGRVKERRKREAGHAERQAAEQPVQESDVERRELHALVRERIESLEPGSRDVVMLHYFSGKSSKEIAALLELNAATVRKRLERARKELGKRLLEEAGEEFQPSRKAAKTIMGAVAASAVTWKGGAASAATLTATGLGIGTTKVAVATTVVLSALAALVIGMSPQGNEASTIEKIATGQEETVAKIANSEDEELSVVAMAVEENKEAEPEKTSAEDTPTQIKLLHGLVIDWNGEPVAAASVHLEVKEQGIGHPDLKPTLYSNRTHTDANGLFQFTGEPLDLTGRYRGEIVISSPRGASLYALSLNSGKLADYRWTFHLRPALQVSGEVQNSEGTPVSGATIKAIDYEPYAASTETFWVSPLATLSTLDGSFAFQQLHEGRWKFLVTAPGYATKETQFLDIASGELQFKMEPGRTLSGRIELSGLAELDDPLMLRVTSDSQRDERHETLVSEDGQFTFDSLRPGKYGLWVDHPDYVYSGSQPMYLIPEAGNLENIVVPVALGGIVEGRLYDRATGKGIPGVNMSMRAMGELYKSTRRFYEMALISTTDTEGRYRIPGLPSGTYSLHYTNNANLPTSSYLASTLSTEVEVKLGDRHAGTDWAIDRRYRITGTVVDDEGRTVMGAHVYIAPEPVEVLSDALSARRELAHPTDSLGNFVIYFHEPVENVFVKAIKPGFASERVGPLRADQSTVHALLTLESAGVLAGRVSKEGGGSERAQISITGNRTGPMTSMSWNVGPTGSSFFSIRPFVSSDRAGYFYHGNLPQDEYTLTVGSDGPGVTVDLGQGEVISGIEIQAKASSIPQISGIVLFSGEPIAGCFLHFGRSYGRSGVDGRFSLDADQADLNGVSVEMHRRRNGMVLGRFLESDRGSVISQRRPLRFEFARGSGTVEGIVYRNEEPWSGAHLTLSLMWEGGISEKLQVETNDKGAYFLDGLPTGSYEVAVRGSYGEYGILFKTAEVQAVDGRVSTQDIEIVSGAATISVSGIDSGERTNVRLLPGEVIIESITEESVRRIQTQTIATQSLTTNGTVEFLLVEPGVYTVCVTAYDASTRGLAQALPTIRYTSAVIEIVNGLQTELELFIE